MIYLCSVYSLGCEDMDSKSASNLMQKRYEYAAKRTADFMKDGFTIFCPIAHCHPIAVKHHMPRTWDFWVKHDLKYIDASSEVWVLCMTGWTLSKGITAEIEYAHKLGKRVVYIECPDYSEGKGVYND